MSCSLTSAAVFSPFSPSVSQAVPQPRRAVPDRGVLGRGLLQRRLAGRRERRRLPQPLPPLRRPLPAGAALGSPRHGVRLLPAPLPAHPQRQRRRPRLERLRRGLSARLVRQHPHGCPPRLGRLRAPGGVPPAAGAALLPLRRHGMQRQRHHRPRRRGPAAPGVPARQLRSHLQDRHPQRHRLPRLHPPDAPRRPLRQLRLHLRRRPRGRRPRHQRRHPPRAAPAAQAQERRPLRHLEHNPLHHLHKHLRRLLRPAARRPPPAVQQRRDHRRRRRLRVPRGPLRRRRVPQRRAVRQRRRPRLLPGALGGRAAAADAPAGPGRVGARDASPTECCTRRSMR